ncbi:MAG: hypothetical protein GDA50_05275 [Alphaproteobacteria bacterium GM202ARS2]|nr:hypothetical protein [Alphaproteobacteria bacterium GM202ARS2]
MVSSTTAAKPKSMAESLSDKERDFLLVLASLLQRHRRPSDALILVEALARLDEGSLIVLRQLSYHRFCAGDFKGVLDAIALWQKARGEKHLPSFMQLLRCKALASSGALQESGKALLDYVVFRDDTDGSYAGSDS